MKNRLIGLGVCAIVSALGSFALSPVVFDFYRSAFLKGRSSLTGISNAYGSVDGFFGCLTQLLSTPQGASVLAATAALLFAILVLSFFDALLEPQDRTQKNGKLGKQSAITGRRGIVKANILWDGGDHPSGPAICIGCIGGKSVFAEAIHACCIAPSGSGKTRASLFETLDYNTWGAQANAIVFDPSLEIWAQSHKALEERGYRTRILDPECVSDSFNPLSTIASLCEKGDTARAQERSREIGAILYPTSGSENDWVMHDSAGAFAGVCYAIASNPGIPIEQKNLWSCVATILEGTKGSDAAPLKDWLKAEGVQAPQAVLSASFRASSDRQESAIVSTLLAGLQPFATDSMRRLTGISTFDMDEVLRGKSIVFFRIGGPSDQRNKLASLFLAMHWAETARQGAKRSSLRPTIVLADEAHCIPKFDLVTAVEQGRKYGYSFYMWLQSLSGLDKYKTGSENGKESILANSNVKVLYRAGCIEDAEAFSKLSGESTVLGKTEGRTTRNGDSGTNVGFAEQRQPVWSPGDLIHTDPKTKGIYVIKSLPGKPERSGCFVVPIKDVTECPTARHFQTAFGSKEHEARFITAEIEKLESKGPRIMNAPEAWIPAELAGQDEDSSSKVDEELFGLKG